MPRTTFFNRSLLTQTALEAAPALLGAILAAESPEGTVKIALTEVEAYEGSIDPGAHAYRGKTARNSALFDPAGHMYVYQHMGIHFCANVVSGPEGTGIGVLMRAGRVIDGVELALKRREQYRDRRRESRLKSLATQGLSAKQQRPAPPITEDDLASGPANLTTCLGINLSANHTNLFDDAPAGDSIFRLCAPMAHDPRSIATGPRIGVTSTAGFPGEYLWRFWVSGDPTVSCSRAYNRAFE